MLEKGIPRSHYEVWKKDKKIGIITSGTLSPILKKGVAIGYVSKEHAEEGETVMINIRNKLMEAQIVKFPFYDPEKFGFKRKRLVD